MDESKLTKAQHDVLEFAKSDKFKVGRKIFEVIAEDPEVAERFMQDVREQRAEMAKKSVRRRGRNISPKP